VQTPQIYELAMFKEPDASEYNIPDAGVQLLDVQLGAAITQNVDCRGPWLSTHYALIIVPGLRSSTPKFTQRFQEDFAVCLYQEMLEVIWLLLSPGILMLATLWLLRSIPQFPTFSSSLM